MKPLTTGSLALGLLICSTLSGCAELLGGQPSSPAESGGTSHEEAPSPVSRSDAPAPAPEQAVDASTPAPVKLEAFGLPLTIDLAPGTAVQRGVVHAADGVEIGDITSEVKVYVFKADAQVKTLATAKARKRVPGCDAQSIVQEGPDHYIFKCKMRSMEPLVLLMLREVNGVTYGCESSGAAKSPTELEPQLAACRTIKSP
ncbi:MAG: hypothetical protein JNK04_05700 [Myxococcales bacterium]|nr:hypothetical protein [Myxococcales bacterium]